MLPFLPNTEPLFVITAKSGSKEQGHNRVFAPNALRYCVIFFHLLFFVMFNAI